MKINLEFLRILFATLCWFFSCNTALHYGGIWNYQANPSNNVEIEFKSGTSLSGSLSRGWDNSFVLVKADGTRILFTENVVSMISFKHPVTTYSFWESWRAWMPSVLVTAIFTLYMLSGFLSARQRKSEVLPD